MKKFVHKVQDFGKKAAEFKAMVQSAPTKAAELREAVVLTAGEFQQLRSDVQSNLTGLRANSEDRITAAMREITEAAGVFETAGYHLAGMDLDLALTQRLAVHLEKFDDVPHSTLRSLLASERRATIQSILTGLIKAEETAANTELEGLTYSALVVHVGAAPAIRMCWHSDAQLVEAPAAAAPIAQPAPPPLPTTSTPAFGSFFEHRSTPAPTAPQPQPTSPSVVAPVASSQTPDPAVATPQHESSSPWSRDSLERFKKMPGISKYKR